MHHVMWIYEIILLVLGLSLVGYVIDVIQKNGRIKRIAYGLLCLAWALQTAVLVYEVMHTQALPMMNFIDVTYVYAWILLTLTLIVNRIFPIHFVELFTRSEERRVGKECGYRRATDHAIRREIM